MFLRLLLLFTVVPFVELMILLKLSELHGMATTILLIIVTGIIGTLLARRQGFQVWNQLQKELREGKPPAQPLMDGAMILIASALLVTPGVLTDAVGFLLLFPPFRAVLRHYARSKVGQGSQFIFVNTSGNRPDTPDPVQPPRFDANGQEIIDVEFERKTP